jgi:hypothetical protein
LLNKKPLLSSPKGRDMQEIKAKIMFCKINRVCFIDEKGFDADVEDKMPGFAKECRSFSFGEGDGG